MTDTVTVYVRFDDAAGLDETVWEMSQQAYSEALSEGEYDVNERNHPDAEDYWGTWYIHSGAVDKEGATWRVSYSPLAEEAVEGWDYLGDDGWSGRW